MNPYVECFRSRLLIKRDRNFAPWPNDSRQEVGAIQTEPLVEVHREGDGPILPCGTKCGGVRVRERQRELMILNLGEIHPEESKEIPKRLPIDNAQTEKLVDAGEQILCFRPASTKQSICNSPRSLLLRAKSFGYMPRHHELSFQAGS